MGDDRRGGAGTALWRSRFAAISAAAAIAAVALPAASSASTIEVTTEADAVGESGCSLREAIDAANDNDTGPGGDCTAGTGADVIQLPAGNYEAQLLASGEEDDNASGD